MAAAAAAAAARLLRPKLAASLGHWRDDWHAAAAATAAQSRAGRLSTLEQTVAALREELAHERAAALRQLDAAGKPKAAK